tara:strand:- start:5712 stop:5903 length:192 start_codon:yes stop_codon:yes gene_type:complete
MTFAETILDFETKQAVIIEKSADLERLMQEYKAELKAKFGITDGEKMNVLDVIKAMAKVKDLL